MTALIEEQGNKWQEEFISAARSGKNLKLEQAVRCLRESFRTENNILMELTLDDWVWLKSHRTREGMFSVIHDTEEAQVYLSCIEGIWSDLDVRILINFLRPFTVWHRTEIPLLQRYLKQTLI